MDTKLSTKQILIELIIELRNINMGLYFIEDTTYWSWAYTLKNYKIVILANAAMVDKIRFDSTMNIGRVMVEQIFGSLKNRWPILKAFKPFGENVHVVILTCCILHNYYSEIDFRQCIIDWRLCKDPYVRFHAIRMQL